MNVPTQKPRVTFTCNEDLKAALDEWAEKESRTVSNLCELVMRQAAKEAGFLKEDNELKGDSND